MIYAFTFHQSGQGDPILDFRMNTPPSIACVRNVEGIYAFSGADIDACSSVGLFVSPLECENQITGDRVTPSVVTQGPLKVIGRYPDGTITDFNMAEGVSIPMILHIQWP